MIERIQIGLCLAVSLALIAVLTVLAYTVLPFAAALVLLLKLIPATGRSRIP